MSTTALTASAETTLVVDINRTGIPTDVDGYRVEIAPFTYSMAAHWATDLPLGLVLIEPTQLLHVPGQIGGEYRVALHERGVAVIDG